MFTALLTLTVFASLLNHALSNSQCQSVVTGLQLLILYSFTGTLSSPQGTITGAELRYVTQNLQQPLVWLLTANSVGMFLCWYSKTFQMWTPLLVQAFSLFVSTPKGQILLFHWCPNKQGSTVDSIIICWIVVCMYNCTVWSRYEVNLHFYADIPLQCSGISCSSNSTFSLTLETSVTFIPTYSSPSQVLRSTTTNVRTLPQDFLYPFFIPSSAHMLTSCWKHIITILVLLALFS